MNRFRLRASLFSASLFGSALLLCPTSHAQGAAGLQGHALDGSGRPVHNAVVRLVSDQTVRGGRTWRYTLMGDSLGKFSQEGLAPGAYLVMLFTDGKASRVLETIQLRAGETREIDFTVGAGSSVQMASNRSGAWMGERR